MDLMYNLFFYLIAFIIIFSALGAVFLPRIVYSAISLIIAFLAAAALFVLLNADFLAISQIIIYGVGITIILIFAIMFTATDSDKKLWVACSPRTLIAFATAGCFFLLISYALTGGFTTFCKNIIVFKSVTPLVKTIETLQAEGTSGIIGDLLLIKYVLPFEILSLLLIAVIIGATVISRKDGERLINPTTPDYEDN